MKNRKKFKFKFKNQFLKIMLPLCFCFSCADQDLHEIFDNDIPNKKLTHIISETGRAESCDCCMTISDLTVIVNDPFFADDFLIKIQVGDENYCPLPEACEPSLVTIGQCGELYFCSENFPTDDSENPYSDLTCIPFNCNIDPADQFSVSLDGLGEFLCQQYVDEAIEVQATVSISCAPDPFEIDCGVDQQSYSVLTLNLTELTSAGIGFDDCCNPIRLQEYQDE